MIKKIILASVAVTLSMNVFSQNSNAVFFSENGEQFYVIINGLRQNQKAETNVKITGLNPTNYKAKIIFDNKALGSIDKNVFLESGKEYTYIIKNKSGVYALKLYSMVDLPFENTPPSSSGNNSPDNTSTTTTISQSSTVASPQVGGTQFSMNVNLGGVGGNLGMNVSANDGFYQETTTTTTTISTTGSSQPNHYEMPGYSGPVGCPWPMSDNDFQKAKQTISSISFDDSKLTIAKQVINTNCLFSKHVREIMVLFSFEDTRLELAKYAYGYTYDKGNYYSVNDAFDFESSIDELNNYIKGR